MSGNIQLIDLYRNLRCAQQDISKTQRFLQGLNQTELTDNLVAIRQQLTKVSDIVSAPHLTPELQTLKDHYYAIFNSYTGLELRVEIQLSKLRSLDARPAPHPALAA